VYALVRWCDDMADAAYLLQRHGIYKFLEMKLFIMVGSNGREWSSNFTTFTCCLHHQHAVETSPVSYLILTLMSRYYMDSSMFTIDLFSSPQQ
jgi:hypothetical protein